MLTQATLSILESKQATSQMFQTFFTAILVSETKEENSGDKVTFPLLQTSPYLLAIED